MEVGSEYLLEALERGAHAASDYYETAASQWLPPSDAAGAAEVSQANPSSQRPGGGRMRSTASTPALPSLTARGRPCPRSRWSALVAGAKPGPRIHSGFLGTYRLLLSDLVLTMSEEPMADSEKVRSLLAAIRSASRSGRDPHGLQAPSGRRSRDCGSDTSRPRRPPPLTHSPGTSKDTTAEGSPPRGISPTESDSALT